MKHARRLLMVLGLLILGVLTGSTEYRSEVCVKCLQHARVKKQTWFMAPIYFRRTLSQQPGGIMSASTFTPGGVPAVDPHLYAKIFGAPCEHAFKKGGFGRTSGCVHGDGTYTELRFYQPRMDAIRALYAAHAACPDVALGRQVYGTIDRMFPVGKERPTARFSLCRNLCADAFDPLVARLAAVKTREEWPAAAALLERLAALMAEAEASTDAAKWSGVTNEIARLRAEITAGARVEPKERRP